MKQEVQLLGLLPEDLEGWIGAQGVSVRPEHVRRILARVISEGAQDLVTRRAVPRRLVELLEQRTRRDRLELVERVTDSADGFVKYLFRSPDGALSEAVRIPLKKPGRFTVCLSSQVGCAMGCVFCATGRLGLTRNLEAWEMVAAFVAVRDEAPGRVTGAVFQGQGEPLHNYDEVIQAARVLSHPCGGRIAAEAITISTVGLVPAIRRYAEEGHKFRLIVSLTSAVEERRAALLPVAGKFALGDLRDALRLYASSSPFGRQTVALVVMSGVNTDAAEVEGLRELLSGLRVRLNLIDVNDSRPRGFQPPGSEELKGFLDRLQVLEAPIVRRYSGGASRHAACGMLAAVRSKRGGENHTAPG